MIRGSRLCGGVTFDFDRFSGPFELCHCSRCRKVSGSAFMAGVVALRGAFRLPTGGELIRTYDAPSLKAAPAYRSCFCGLRITGSRPVVRPRSRRVPSTTSRVRPDKHICAEKKAAWYHIADALPQLDEAALRRLRSGSRCSARCRTVLIRMGEV